LTDNGAIYTAKSRYGRNGLETELERLGVVAKHSSPYHPQTCGKVCDYVEHAAPARPDPGQGMTKVSFVRSVGRHRCCALVRTGQTDLT